MSDAAARLTLSSGLARGTRVALLAMLAMLAFAGFSASASAQDFPGYLTVIDQQGANDQPSQVDLTQFGRNDDDADTYRLFWSWDSTSDWTGTGQTGDACALFDSDGDGNVNFVVCVRVENTNAQTTSVTQEPGSPYAFTCSDAKNDRCTNPDPVDIDPGDVITGSLDPATSVLGLSTDNLITDTDPFPNTNPDQDWPDDTTIGIDILKSLLPNGGVGVNLVNVCSYPSAGNGGNNNPFDCIIRPGDGLMMIVKQTDQATNEPFDFTASNPGGGGIAAVSKDFTIIGAGQTAAFGMTSGNGTTVSEDPETLWDLDSATCVLEDGTPTGGSGVDGRSVESVTVNPGEVTTCTFVNSLITGAIDLEKTPDASAVDAGQQIGFTIDVTNAGPGNATNVTVTDTLPTQAGLVWTIDAANSDAGCSIATGTLTCNWGTLGDDASKSVHITSPTTAASCATINNTANVTTTESGTDNDSASVVVRCPNISITKTADIPSTVSAGAPIGFVVTITNSGTGAATGLTFTDDLPNGLTWSIVAAHTDPGWSLNGSNDLVYSPTSLAGNSSTTVHVVAVTDANDCGVVSNTASVNATNDSVATQSATATATVNCPDIDIVKNADASPVNAGAQIGFTVTISNDGDGDATGLTFSDDLPNGLTWTIVAADSDAGWSIDGSGNLAYAPTTLAANSSSTVHVVATTDGGDCGTIPNTAFVNAANDNDPQDSDGASVVVNCPNLSIVKDADASPVNAGQQIGFTVTITNSGAGTATGLTFTDDLPNGLTWSIATPSAGWSLNGSNDLVYSPTTLAGNSSTSVHVIATTDASDCGTVPNTATVNATNDTASAVSDSASVTVNCPSLSIAKDADASPVNSGQQIGFTVTITNSGAGAATGLSFTDDLPNGLTWSIATPSAGWSLNGSNDLVYSPTSLAGNTSTSVHVVATTDGTDCGTVPNTATVDATNDAAQAVSDSASVVVNCPSLDILKTADASPVSAGDQIGFTVTITNSGAGTATGLSFTDDLPNGLTWSIATPSAGWSINGSGDLVYAPSTLAGNSSTSVHVVATTDASDCGVVPNTASINATNDTASADTSSASVTVECPAIHVVKTADADNVSAGDVIGFTVTLSNTGNGEAKGLQFTDALPSGGGALSWSISPASAGWTINGSNLVYTPSTLAGNSSTTVHVIATTVKEDCGTINNTATLSSSNDDTESDSASVNVKCGSVDLTKTADADSVNTGSQIGFVLEVTNKGDGEARNVTVTDTLPTNAGLDWSIDAAGSDLGCSIANGTLTCLFGTLAPNASAQVHIVSPTTPASCGVVNNTGAVSTSNDGGDTADDSVTVNCHPAINIDKSGPANAQAGDKVTYTLLVTNPGDVPIVGQTLAITDPKCEAPPALVAKARGNVDDPTPLTLDPGDTWSYMCSVQTQVGETQVVNVADANGFDVNGVAVSDSDDATTTLSQPVIQVLPETIVSGASKLRGPSSCVKKAFEVRVTGKRMAKVTITIDGRKVKTFRRSLGEGTKFVYKVDPGKYGKGIHRLKARVVYNAASQTKPRTLQLSFERCAKQVVAPQFTG